MIHCPFLLLLLAGPALAMPPEPCLSAGTFDAALTALEGDGWAALSPKEDVPDAVAALLGWALIEVRYIGGEERVEVRPNIYRRNIDWLRDAARRGDTADRRVRVLTRDGDALLLSISVISPEGHALLYCSVAGDHGAVPVTTPTGISDPLRVETEGGWFTTVRLDADRLAEMIGQPVTTTVIYQSVLHLLPE